MSSHKLTPTELLHIRMDEATRIYKGSPGVQLTYTDAVRIYEDLSEILDIIEKVHEKKVGFQMKDIA